MRYSTIWPGHRNSSSVPIRRGDPALAECVAVAFYGAYDVEVLDDSFDYYTELDNIEQDCLDAT